ncbi:hypothetical protein DESC_10027 [Desulfosarcina cetonica]|nr:hypothetical protein DESC_10027 [Desulfosarcina cetonica]
MHFLPGHFQEGILQVHPADGKPAVVFGCVGFGRFLGFKIGGLHPVALEAIHGPATDGSHEMLRRVQAHDTALVDKGHALCQKFRLFDVVGGEKDRDAVLLDFLDQSPEPATNGGVQPHRGFVQKEDRGGMQKRPGDHDASFHAAGEFLDQGVAFFLQLDVAQKFIDARADGLASHVVQAAVDQQIFMDGQLAVQVDVLGHQAVLPLGRQGFGFDIVPPQPGAAAGKAGQAGEDADGGGLAGAVGAQVGEKFALVHRQVDAGKGRHLAVVFFQVGNPDHEPLDILLFENNGLRKKRRPFSAFQEKQATGSRYRPYQGLSFLRFAPPCQWWTRKKPQFRRIRKKWSPPTDEAEEN